MFPSPTMRITWLLVRGNNLAGPSRPAKGGQRYRSSLVRKNYAKA